MPLFLARPDPHLRPDDQGAGLGLLNFRSLAGTTARDGQRLRAGRLFRAGHFDRLDDRQADLLRFLGIQGVCDLRSVGEQVRHPSPLPGCGIRQLIAPPQSDPVSALAIVGDPQASPADVRQAMLALYAATPERFAPVFRAMFDAVLACRGGVLLQCAIGKDRTGMAVSLLLAALGVPRPQVMADYAASGAAVPQIFAALASRNPDRDPPPAEMLAPMLAADPEYLQAFWATLDRDHGGEAGYLAGTLGLGADVIGALRMQLMG